MDWHDFNIGIEVRTDEGKAFVESVDKLNNEIKVTLVETGEFRTLGINQIYQGMGQIKLSFCTHIGQFILFFQRLENRMKDFVNYTYDLNLEQRRELTSDFTAGKLKSTIDKLFKKYSNDTDRHDWRNISVSIDYLLKVRNTIIHGYTFNFNENYELDFNSLYIENSIGKAEFLNFSKLQDLIGECVKIYYLIHELFEKKQTK